MLNTLMILNYVTICFKKYYNWFEKNVVNTRVQMVHEQNHHLMNTINMNISKSIERKNIYYHKLKSNQHNSKCQKISLEQKS